jgi:hypothetical protein
MKIHPPLTLQGKVEALFATVDASSFETSPVASLALGFDGIAGDRHAGLTRRTGGREPWYPRGTHIRNERQLSILSPNDLAEAAAAMGIPVLGPEWIGGNLLLSGVPRLTMLPPRTCLFVENGPTIRIDGLNVPCRLSGRSVAARFPERENLDVAFVKAARRLRGLVGWVEKPGLLRNGDLVEVRLPEQWIYDPAASA